jgi:hypothetical protein
MQIPASGMPEATLNRESKETVSMSKKIVTCLALVSLLALGGQAVAEICTIDDVPAATLLLPYFEVDLNSPNGVTTLFSINNASASAALAHITVWTDLSVPVLDFDVYLTGYDVQTMNMRDIVNGILPQTLDNNSDVPDVVSPNGDPTGTVLGDPLDLSFPGTSGPCIATYNPLSGAFVSGHLKPALTGNASSLSNCVGVDYDDNIARGYVTVDLVSECNLDFPSTPGYFTSVAAFDNILWGDYFYVEPGENFAQGETLVHIEACVPPGSSTGTGTGLPDPENCPFVPGDHTFYGRYASATAIDQREALPTTLAARYLNGGGFDGGTDFLVWREGDAAAAGYSCALPGPTAAWYPLDAVQIVLFDEEENPVQQEDCPSGDPTCLQEITIPNEAQRIDVALDLLTPFEFGWAWLNLQHSQLIAAYGDDDAQAWVTTVMDAEGRFSVGFDAIQLDNANTPNTIVLPVTGVITQ